MARTLIENLASHFDPDQYKDEFRSTLLELIDRKMKGEQRAAKRYARGEIARMLFEAGWTEQEPKVTIKPTPPRALRS